MKTTTILKTLAMALLMPTMLLTAACSNSDDIVNTEKPANTKGYALPVTVNVTRQGGDATRAIYDESTRKLSFSTGDKLFVAGFYDNYEKRFAGLLTWQSGGTFSGTIMTQTEYSGTAAERLASADYCYAVLMPAGYTEYGYLSIGKAGAYDAYLMPNPSKAFALTKKEAVEQLSYELAAYSNGGFALAPQYAIVSFTISGLAANTEVAVCFKAISDEDATPRTVTTNAEGVATFAVGMYKNENFDDYSLTVDGFAIALPENKEVEAGKIYNMSRPVPSVKWNSTDISSIDFNAGGSKEIRGITFACDGNGAFQESSLYSFNGNISFTSSLGNIKKIEINHSLGSYWAGADGFDGWPSGYTAEGGTFTWEGTPTETVELPESEGYGYIIGITSIVFTLE